MFHITHLISLYRASCLEGYVAMTLPLRSDSLYSLNCLGSVTIFGIKCLLSYSLLDCCLYLEVNASLKVTGNRYLSSLIDLHEMPNLGIDEVFSV